LENKPKISIDYIVKMFVSSWNWENPAYTGSDFRITSTCIISEGCDNLVSPPTLSSRWCIVPAR